LRHVCDNICDMFATGLVCGPVGWGKDRKIERHGDGEIGRQETPRRRDTEIA